ncbi:MAG: CBS domain-containing protein [Deltaproteobacteria bacterium]|nr:CBS domain-containing protein [Deltaproteobacteria bacterium]MBN2688450.1 CBS domain-containing protein [Deltaproteobacteria bacterium]
MFVGRRMTRNLITVTPDTSILKVKNLLNQYNIDQVPVVEGKNLVGVVTDRDIRENSASPASTLSIHELNYLLSEMKVGEIMTKKLYTVSPGTTIEDAVSLINEKRVNALPVVVGRELVGIITTCDMLNVLLEVMGVGTPSVRVELTLSSSMGEIRKIAGIVNDMGLRIISIVSTISREKENTRTTVIRVNANDSAELCHRFEEAGYSVTTDYKVEK